MLIDSPPGSQGRNTRTQTALPSTHNRRMKLVNGLDFRKAWIPDDPQASCIPPIALEPHKTPHCTPTPPHAHLVCGLPRVIPPALPPQCTLTPHKLPCLQRGLPCVIPPASAFPPPSPRLPCPPPPNTHPHLARGLPYVTDPSSPSFSFPLTATWPPLPPPLHTPCTWPSPCQPRRS